MSETNINDNTKILSSLLKTDKKQSILFSVIADGLFAHRLSKTVILCSLMGFHIVQYLPQNMVIKW